MGNCVAELFGVAAGETVGTPAWDFLDAASILLELLIIPAEAAPIMTRSTNIILTT